MLIKDRSAYSNRRYTDEGYLIVTASIARTGIQDYHAYQMGRDDLNPLDVIKVYRPPEEVFKKDSMESFQHCPVTNNHPPESVDVSNYDKFSVGHAIGDIERSDNKLQITLKITNPSAIKDVETGKVEISNGYNSKIEWVKGVTEDGEHYDAIQRNIVGNHIALVDKGRCGPECKIDDSQLEVTKMPKITIDGVDFEVAENAAQAVQKLKDRLTDAEEEAKKTKMDMEEEKKKKDMEMKEASEKSKKSEDTLQAKLDDAVAKIPNADQLDILVNNRIKTRDAALELVPDYNWESKDCEIVRKEVVAKRCPDLKMDGLSTDYIRSRFDALTESNTTADIITGAFKDSAKSDDTSSKGVLADARSKFLNDSRNAWKGETK